jgi:hypothetical protein
MKRRVEIKDSSFGRWSDSRKAPRTAFGPDTGVDFDYACPVVKFKRPSLGARLLAWAVRRITGKGQR